MCEFETRLIAWIDGELDRSASRKMELHVERCGACSAKAASYREVSCAFAAYFELPVVPPRSSRPLAAALAGLVAAAAAAIILWVLRPLPATLAPSQPKLAASPPAAALLKQPPIVAPPSVTRTRRHSSTNSVARAKLQPVDPQPTIEIAIPADAMFPPGAFPTGFAFAADLSIRGDGSPEALRVRPATYLK